MQELNIGLDKLRMHTGILVAGFIGGGAAFVVIVLCALCWSDERGVRLYRRLLRRCCPSCFPHTTSRKEDTDLLKDNDQLQNNHYGTSAPATPTPTSTPAADDVTGNDVVRDVIVTENDIFRSNNTHVTELHSDINHTKNYITNPHDNDNIQQQSDVTTAATHSQTDVTSGQDNSVVTSLPSSGHVKDVYVNCSRLSASQICSSSTRGKDGGSLLHTKSKSDPTISQTLTANDQSNPLLMPDLTRSHSNNDHNDAFITTHTNASDPEELHRRHPNSDVRHTVGDDDDDDALDVGDSEKVSISASPASDGTVTPTVGVGGFFHMQQERGVGKSASDDNVNNCRPSWNRADANIGVDNDDGEHNDDDNADDDAYDVGDADDGDARNNGDADYDGTKRHDRLCRSRVAGSASNIRDFSRDLSSTSLPVRAASLNKDIFFSDRSLFRDSCKSLASSYHTALSSDTSSVYSSALSTPTGSTPTEEISNAFSSHTALSSDTTSVYSSALSTLTGSTPIENISNAFSSHTALRSDTSSVYSSALSTPTGGTRLVTRESPDDAFSSHSALKENSESDFYSAASTPTGGMSIEESPENAFSSHSDLN